MDRKIWFIKHHLQFSCNFSIVCHRNRIVSRNSRDVRMLSCSFLARNLHLAAFGSTPIPEESARYRRNDDRRFGNGAPSNFHGFTIRTMQWIRGGEGGGRGVLSVPLIAKIPGWLYDVSRVITVLDKCLGVAQYPNFVDHRKSWPTAYITEICSYFHPVTRKTP